MSNGSINIDNLNEAIINSLEDYNLRATESIKNLTTEAMKELVKDTKRTAPVGKRRKHYKSNITSKKLSENEYGISKLWYVKGSDYRLTHLLNNGHALRNGGRVEGTHFIQKASDPITKQYLEAVEEIIKNG
jgi:hypothetical protein